MNCESRQEQGRMEGRPGGSGPIAAPYARSDPELAKRALAAAPEGEAAGEAAGEEGA